MNGYRFGKAVPVTIYIDGEKVDAPNAGIKIGTPIFPPHGVLRCEYTYGVALGDFMKSPETEPILVKD